MDVVGSPPFFRWIFSPLLSPTHHCRTVLATVIMMTRVGVWPLAGRGMVENCCLGEDICCRACEETEPRSPTTGCCATKAAQPGGGKTKPAGRVSDLPSGPRHVCPCAWNAPRVPSPADRPHGERQDEIQTASRQELTATRWYPRPAVTRAANDVPLIDALTPSGRQALLCRWLT